MRRSRFAISLLLTGAAILLTDGVSSANPRSLSGVVQTGGTRTGQPLPNVHVTLFEATPAAPAAVGDATTNASGRFTIPYRTRSSSSIFFLTADIGEGVEFVTVLGSSLPESATVNELTTVVKARDPASSRVMRPGASTGLPARPH